VTHILQLINLANNHERPAAITPN